MRSTQSKLDSSSRSSSSSSSFSYPASASVARVSCLRAALFDSKATARTCALAQLPTPVLRLAGDYLEDKDKSLIKLAQTSKSTYQALYPVIKRALVRVLKKLVAEDNVIQVRRLLACHPYLQLRQDKGDPLAFAYRDLSTTPYQDALAEPMAEEMRTLLAESFPGETKEERSRAAALQLAEFEEARFAKFREEKRQWFELTRFAYGTLQRRYDAWVRSGHAPIHYQSLRDAWTRVGLAQGQWPQRLRKIFSAVSMDEKQTFADLSVDLADPHFDGNVKNFWSSDRIGCDLHLLPVPRAQDLTAPDFQTTLVGRRDSDGCPVLIRHGEGMTAAFYLYAPQISLERDESEWRRVLIDDPRLNQLIRLGHFSPGRIVGRVDFRQPKLLYSPLFNELYQFGCAQGLHLGSGHSLIYSAYNSRNKDGRAIAVRRCESSPWGNFVAVATLFKIRAERLEMHHARNLRECLSSATPVLR